VDNLKDIIAENIVLLRKRDNLTQLELAEKLNYTDKAVSKWERGESIPDVFVLKQIADIFNVSVDYLLEEEHKSKIPPIFKKRNKGFIIGLSVLLVWFIATLAFVIFDIILSTPDVHWLAFVYAVPVSLLIWLILNSIWFNQRVNFLIISFLVWAILLSVFVSFVCFGSNLWQILLVGIPSQAIIIVWSRIRKK